MEQNPYDAPPSSPYYGMTINERLVVAGEMEKYEAAALARDRDGMLQSLLRTDLPLAAAEQTCDTVLANPAFYGF